MNRDMALPIANSLVELFAPACKRPPEIAGSLRRLKPDVNDIDIVLVPDLHQPRLTFGQRAFPTMLDTILASLELGDDDHIRLHALMNGPKEKRFWVSLDGGQRWVIKLDLYLVTPPADWGVLYLLRTGPKEFSHWIVAQQFLGGGLPNGYIVKDGRVQSFDGQYIPCPEEIDFLRFCGLDWIEPKDRQPVWQRSDRTAHIHQPVKS